MAIQRRTYVPKNKIYYPINKIEIGEYYLLEMRATLEYFTIIDKIINKCKDNNIIKEKENSIFKSEPISSRAINIGSYSEPYKEKSFFENASFFLSTVKYVVKTTIIDTKVDEINEYRESLKVYSMAKEVYYSENETFRNMINKFFRKYPDYKQANDKFDRLQDKKTQKIKQLNNLIIELNNFRQFILDEYNPIVLELLDLLEEDESKIKIEYMNFLGKLYQMINYSFKSTSSKDITKSDMLLKWDELKSNIEILEKDNKELDNEITKILENDSFKNYKSQNFEYFHTTKVKLNSLIKQNRPKINKLPKVEKDEELENLKKELKSLEEKLQNLVIEKTEYLNNIEEFNIQYNIHLGDIIKSILSLKKEILYKKTIKYQKIKDTYEEEIKTFDETKDTITELKETISELEEALENIDKDDENYDEIYKAYQELQEELENLEDELYSQEQKLDETREQLEDDELFNEYEDVKSAYKEFENEYEHIKDNQKDTIKLNDDEKVEIKKLYKKAARLCHPDIVSDELKEKAHEIMQALNDAYSKKDITKVKEILLNLETGISFEVSSNSIEDKEILKAKIEEFKKTIQELKNEIEEIKSDDTFVTISSLDDWDEYFEELKRDLEDQKKKLEIEVKEFLKKEEQKNEVEEWVNVFYEWTQRVLKYKNNISNNLKTLKDVQVLNLGHSNLKSIPADIRKFKKLKSLYLHKNDLYSLPSEIIELTQLERLNIENNSNLVLSIPQKLWIQKLKDNNCNVSMDKILNGSEERSLNTTLMMDSKSWMNSIWRWADEYNIPESTIPRDPINLDSISKLGVSGYDIKEIPHVISNLKRLTWLSFSNNQISEIPKEIFELKNLKELKFWNNKIKTISEDIGSLIHLENLILGNNNLQKLPDNICKLVNLKELNIVNNFGLILTERQRIWINELLDSGCKVDIDSNMINVNKKQNLKSIQSENSPYAKHIQSIENIRFEKIRKYCENLSKSNEADEMQKHLGEQGKMYKALMYSSLEVLFEKEKENLNGETITLCDWGCGQGIASMQVLDYIKEKQLDIKVSDVILIDDDTKALGRAMIQGEALAQNNIKFIPIKSDDNNISDTIKSNKNNIVLNLFANDKIPTSFWTVNYDIFDESYFLCVSNENNELVDEIYENINSFIDVQDLSILDGKIGRFDKYERIFKIDNNGIPF
jgi:hypothetical protein